MLFWLCHVDRKGNKDGDATAGTIIAIQFQLVQKDCSSGSKSVSNTKFRIKFRREDLPTARSLDMKKAEKLQNNPTSVIGCHLEKLFLRSSKQSASTFTSLCNFSLHPHFPQVQTSPVNNATGTVNIVHWDASATSNTGKHFHLIRIVINTNQRNISRHRINHGWGTEQRESDDLLSNLPQRNRKKKKKSEIISITSQKGRYGLTKTMITYDTIPCHLNTKDVWYGNKMTSQINQIKLKFWLPKERKRCSWASPPPLQMQNHASKQSFP